MQNHTRWWFFLACCWGFWSVACMGEVEGLASQLRSDFSNVREQACVKLGNIGEPALKVLGALRRALRMDRSDNVRRCIADTLGKIGPAAHAALPVLVEALKDPSSGVRMAAAEAIGSMKEKAMPTLKELMTGKDLYNQLYAVHAMAKLGPQSLPLLQLATQSNILQIRQTAAETAVSIGRLLSKYRPITEVPRFQKIILDMLLKLLKTTPENKLRSYISWVLGELAPPAMAHSATQTDALLSTLTQILDNAPEQVKMYAAFTLRKLGQYAAEHAQARPYLRKAKGWPQTLQRLRELLQDDTWYIRKHAASAYGALIAALQPAQSSQKNSTVPAKDEHKEFLAQFEKEQSQGIQALERALFDVTWDVRYAATSALRELRGSERLQALLRAVRTPHVTLREHLVRTLGWVGKEAQEGNFPKQRDQELQHITTALLRALRDPEEKVQKAASQAFGTLGIPALQSLQAQMQKAPIERRILIIQSFEKIGPKVPASLQKELRDQLQHPKTNSKLQHHLLLALRAISPTSEKELHRLTQSLLAGKLDESGMIAAITQLGTAKSPTKEIFAALQHALERKEETIRHHAIVVLGSFGLLSLPTLQAIMSQWPQMQRPEHRQTLLAVLGRTSQTLLPEAAPLLQRALQSERLELQHAALEALESFSPSPQLFSLLLKPMNRSPTRLLALKVAGKQLESWKMGRKSGSLREMIAKKVIPSLLESLKHRDEKVRVAAAEALASAGEEGITQIFPALFAALRDAKPKVRSQAATSLGWLLPAPLLFLWREEKAKRAPAKAREATQWVHRAALALTVALRDRDPRVRKSAIFAVGHAAMQSSRKQRKQWHELLHKALRMRPLPHFHINFCLVLARLQDHDSREESIQNIESILAKPRLDPTTKTQCRHALNHIKSDDKPYVLWVNHPRSPTLEGFSPAIFFPPGP